VTTNFCISSSLAGTLVSRLLVCLVSAITSVSSSFLTMMLDPHPCSTLHSANRRQISVRRITWSSHIHLQEHLIFGEAKYEMVVYRVSAGIACYICCFDRNFYLCSRRRESREYSVYPRLSVCLFVHTIEPKPNLPQG